MRGISIKLIGVSWFCAFMLIDAANILIMTPFFSRSHFAFNNAMAIDLLNAGHQITIVSSISHPLRRKNYTLIVVPQSSNKSDQTNNLPVSEALGITRTSMFDMLVAETERDCYNVMQLPQMREIVNVRKKQFDIMFIDLVPFMYECFLPIANVLDIPVIGTVAARSWRNVEWVMGNPYNPAVTPFEMSHFSTKMNFIERLTNTWHCISDDFYRYLYIRPKLTKFYEHFANLTPAQSQQPALVFVNGHNVLMPRPLAPNVINVGGLHLPLVEPLPHDLQKFIDEAKDGVILFTVGSTLQSHMMPNEIIDIFRDVFAEIPQRVIWKSEEAIDNISPNVLLSKWLPQRDILAHENVVAFITHCGISGIYEAIDSTTPMVLMPVTFDEMSNAAILEDIGAGIRLNMLALKKDSLLQALKSIIYDKRYKMKIQDISLQLKDQPMTPHESVVFWTEYVLKHNRAKHLKTAAADMPLYQYLLLDVFVFVILILIGSFWILLRAIKKMFLFCAPLSARHSALKEKIN